MFQKIRDGPPLFTSLKKIRQELRYDMQQHNHSVDVAIIWYMYHNIDDIRAHTATDVYSKHAENQ